MCKLLILISIISFSNLCFGQAVTVQNNELKYRIPSGQVRTAANKDSLIALKNLFYTFINNSSSALPDSNGVVSPSNPIGGFSGGITKEMIGLGNVNNTSDLSKPISTATQYALNLKQNVLISGTNIKTIEGGTILGPGNIDLKNIYPKKQNIGVVNITEGYILNHSLNSTKLNVSFFDPTGFQIENIGFQILNSNQIKVFLPIIDKGIYSFSGDIYLTIRN